MVVPSNPHVHLETMEAAEDEDAKFSETGSIGKSGISSRKYTAGILVCDANSSNQYGTNKRKTDTGRLL